ncbi:hypothetical protein [Microcystis phage MaeS]|nr:hypothetical protein [Microcystis phage MaeS]
MADTEIVLINKSRGKFTINFQGAFPVNKVAAKDAKLYLTEREYEWAQSNIPHVLEGDNKRLYLESELEASPEQDDYLSDEEFFKQHHTKVKAGIAKMELEEAESRYRYVQLNEVTEAVKKALEDRLLELDKKD